MTVEVLDRYYLSITLLITIAYQLFFFSIAWTFHFDKLTDFAGGTNFVVLAIITLSFSGQHDARQILASLFIMLWGARLSGFLLFRILKTGKDDRFDDKRNSFFPFLGFWIFQMLWVWTVSLPVTILNSPAISATSPTTARPAFGTAPDIIGLILFALALPLETVADAQKYAFRSKQQAAGGDKAAICTAGVWKWSRHPNYFAEIVCQFGIYLIALTPAAYPSLSHLPTSSRAALASSVVGPVFLTVLLLCVSGLPLQEKPGAKKRWERSTDPERGDGGKEWEKYREYLGETSILVPMPRRVWRGLPVWVKRTVGCEWGMFVFVPERDGRRDGEGRGEGEAA